MSTHKSGRQIDAEQTLEQQQRTCLPGKYQRTFQPETGGNEEVPEIAEKKKILRTVFPPVDRSPDHHPRCPEYLEPERDPHDSVLYPLASSRNPQAPKAHSGKA